MNCRDHFCVDWAITHGCPNRDCDWYVPSERAKALGPYNDPFPYSWEDLEYDVACTMKAQTKLLDRAIYQTEAGVPQRHNGAWTLLELPSLVSL